MKKTLSKRIEKLEALLKPEEKPHAFIIQTSDYRFPGLEHCLLYKEAPGGAVWVNCKFCKYRHTCHKEKQK